MLTLPVPCNPTTQSNASKDELNATYLLHDCQDRELLDIMHVVSVKTS